MKNFLLFIGLAAITACVEDKQMIPEGVLGKEKMHEVLIDVHLLEAKVEKLKKPEDSILVYAKEEYEKLYYLHHITEQQFQRSFQFYQDNPNLMNEMYQQMIEEMTQREAELKVTEGESAKSSK